MNTKAYLDACFTESESILQRKLHNPRDYWFVYTLQLAGKKVYVGQTQNIYAALYQHKNKEGAQWTTLHEYQDVISVAHKCHKELDLKHLTFLAMREHGWQNVRSSRFNRVNMSKMPGDYPQYNFDSHDVTYEFMTDRRLDQLRASLRKLEEVALSWIKFFLVVKL